MTDKRTDGTGAISISGKEFREKAAEDSKEKDGWQEVFFHLAAMPEEMREGRNKVKSLAFRCP